MSFNATSTTEIYTLSLHDALPIFHALRMRVERTFAWEDKFKRLLLRFERIQQRHYGMKLLDAFKTQQQRSEEHTSELQSHSEIVCRLLLEKKKRSETWRRLASRVP